jgi:flagella basal body P-ring formation protein FlgA
MMGARAAIRGLALALVLCACLAGPPHRTAAQPAGTGAAELGTVVATQLVRPLAILRPADLELVTGGPPGGYADPAELVGLEARVALYPGRPIRRGDVGPPALVERNGLVELVFVRGGLTILAEGRALGRAGFGEIVRAMNLASRNTVSGRVGADGRVHVAY